MGKGLILVLHDEKDLVVQVRSILEREGFDVTAAMPENGAAQRLDAIILGHTHGGEGLAQCRRLRTQPATSTVPIVYLTSAPSEEDRVAALEAGADDSVTRPFSPRELVARVKAIIRRSSAVSSATEIIQVGDLYLDVGRHQCTFRARPVALTAAEFRILRFMGMRPGRVLSRAEIIEGALDGSVDGMSRTIDVHLASIRRKLGKGAGTIETVRGVGYRIVEGSSSLALKGR